MTLSTFVVQPSLPPISRTFSFSRTFSSRTSHQLKLHPHKTFSLSWPSPPLAPSSSAWGVLHKSVNFRYKWTIDEVRQSVSQGSFFASFCLCTDRFYHGACLHYRSSGKFAVLCLCLSTCPNQFIISGKTNMYFLSNNYRGEIAQFWCPHVLFCWEADIQKWGPWDYQSEMALLNGNSATRIANNR